MKPVRPQRSRKLPLLQYARVAADQVPAGTWEVCRVENPATGEDFYVATESFQLEGTGAIK